MGGVSQRERAGYQGTGPGAITPDGCAVELYARLPVVDEPDIIERAVPAGGSILELGCGVGRVTHPLLRRGFIVTAVDESPQMLERVRGARTICSPIESLELDERFDVVLLASYLVHAGDPQVRHRLLQTCRRQVADGGCVLIQRERVNLAENLPQEQALADGLVRMVSCELVGPDLRSIHVEYVFPDARWTQTYLSCRLTQDAFDTALADAGLVVDRYLTADRTWVRALPVRTAS
jgi:SAM-dependent methyltransferase